MIIREIEMSFNFAAALTQSYPLWIVAILMACIVGPFISMMVNNGRMTDYLIAGMLVVLQVYGTYRLSFVTMKDMKVVPEPVLMPVLMSVWSLAFSILIVQFFASRQRKKV